MLNRQLHCCERWSEAADVQTFWTKVSVRILVLTKVRKYRL